MDLISGFGLIGIILWIILIIFTTWIMTIVIHWTWFMMEKRRKRSQLYLAAGNGHVGTVKALIKAGADVNARNTLGETPQHLAAQNGHAETVTALVKAGAEVDARNEKGRTPLHVAARWGNAETVEALLKAGADVRAKDKDGRLPADLAEDGG